MVFSELAEQVIAGCATGRPVHIDMIEERPTTSDFGEYVNLLF